MNKTEILKNIDYSILNNSNYSIVEKETRDIVDVPYFPAQNLVDVSGNISLYSPDVQKYIPFIDENNKERIFCLLKRKDSRYLFSEIAENSRYLHYRFVGDSYPQDREDESITYDGENLIIFSGYANGRCMDDLWVYNQKNNFFKNVNFSIKELGVNTVPSRRRKANIVKIGTKLVIFGGETDILAINTRLIEGKKNSEERQDFFIPLNDLWVFDEAKDSWTNFDKFKKLPHRIGNIIFYDGEIVKILVKEGKNELGILEPTKIYTYNTLTEEVTSQPIVPPFSVSSNNICLYIDGKINILSENNLFEWNNDTSEFILKKQEISCFNPKTKSYWKVIKKEKFFGSNSAMKKINVSEGFLYDETDSLIATNTIDLPPKGLYIPKVTIGNLYTFFFGGLITNDIFNESTYLFNHQTLKVEKLEFDPENRPQERVFCSLTYDKYNHRVLLFGGFDGSKFYNDLWAFNLDTKVWEKLLNGDEFENMPAPRQKAGLACVADGFIYIISGYSDVNSFSDFWKYNVNTGEMKKEISIDDIPWGSEYYIFEWQDRLWLFNGQKLYRYFYDSKTFVDQPFNIRDYDSANGEIKQDPFKTLIEQKKFLNSPISISKIENFLFVFNDNFKLRINLKTRDVLNLKEEFGIKNNLIWLDSYLGLDNTTLCSYYINVSPLQPLTKNQIPHSFYSSKISYPYNDGLFFTNLGAEEGDNSFSYKDNSGFFSMKGEYLSLDKKELFINNELSFCGKPSEHPEVNFTDEGLFEKTLDILKEPTTYPVSPWFLYSKSSPVGYKFDGCQKVINFEKEHKTYIIYRNGNTVKINNIDNTFFVYYTALWEGSALAFYDTEKKVYCFGGFRENTSEEATNSISREPYMQSGLKDNPIIIEIPGGSDMKEASHQGLIEFDLKINEMNVGSIESYLREKKVQSVDYSLTKEYLLNLLNNYLENGKSNTPKYTTDQIKEKLYTATQPLIDDMSQFDFCFETGTRPWGRVFTLNCQTKTKMFIFGGSEAIKNKYPLCPLVTFPGGLSQPGEIHNMKVGDDLERKTDSNKNARFAGCFDMANKKWEELPPLPYWIYGGTAILSPDEKEIYLVGGYRGEDCQNISNKILVYNIQNKTYEELKGIPEGFSPRAFPLCYWLDEEKLLIQHGTFTIKVMFQGLECYQKYFHMPVQDSWIYNKRSNIFYKAFEDLSGNSGILVKDTFYIDEEKKQETLAHILASAPVMDAEGKTKIMLYQWDLTEGKVTPIKINPTTPILEDFNQISYNVDPSNLFENMDNSGLADFFQGFSGSEEEFFFNSILNSNFKFRYSWIQEYGAYRHKHLFIIGERCDKSGVQFIQEMAQGYREAHLRIWYADLELPAESRFLKNIPYEYPLPIAPVAIAYDGTQYLYLVYNKYNIWRLNLKKVLEDETGNWWYQLPPCLDCNFLGDNRTDPIWDSFFIKPNYLVLLSKTGMFAKMDVNTFAWFLEKEIPPVDSLTNSPLISASGVDDGEIYLYKVGGISGKTMKVYENQWDNFYFDMRDTARVSADFSAVVDQKLFPTILQRKRLYTINHLGHIFYSWLRIYGKYDIEYQLLDFFEVEEIRVYGDQKFLSEAENLKIEVFDIQSGWISFDSSHEDFSVVNTETDWDWDGNYTRRYVRYIENEHGHVVKQYTKRPNNYVSLNLTNAIGAKPISKVKIFYQNNPSPVSFMSRINGVEAIAKEGSFELYDNVNGDTPLQIVHIQPLSNSQDYSNEFAVFVKNTSSQMAYKIKTYLYGNDWLQFSLDNQDSESWSFFDEKESLLIANELASGEIIKFYVRSVNIDRKPHTGDLIVKGTFAYEG